jgi:SAM-dependent methyltransferase
MAQPLNYIEVNRALWNQKTKFHVSSEFYGNESFLAGRSTLNQYELDLLGDVAGKSVLHLQCHFGQDTLSLARLGADVTGVDFSDEAIQQARELNSHLGLSAAFICTDIYNLPAVHDVQYDIVFTSYGTIGWLPDMKQYAEVVAKFLKPGGAFIIVDFHPVAWMFSSDFSKVEYSYFNKEAIVETLEGTYADRNADLMMTEIGWNHNLAEIIQSLITAGLTVSSFQEFENSPYNCFQNMVETAPGMYQIKGMEGKLPLVYALKCIR